MIILTDHHCPQCNLVVKGKETESFDNKPRRPATVCQHCKTPVKLVCHRDNLGNELASRTYSYVRNGRAKESEELPMEMIVREDRLDSSIVYVTEAEPETDREAFVQAAAMLDAISNGKSFRPLQFHAKMEQFRNLLERDDATAMQEAEEDGALGHDGSKPTAPQRNGW